MTGIAVDSQVVSQHLVVVLPGRIHEGPKAGPPSAQVLTPKPRTTSLMVAVIVDPLNILLAILFPLWPWELFMVMPFVLAYYASKNTAAAKKNLILFITIFGAVFAGVGHTAGLIQAFQTAFGGKGICVPALPGAPKDIDTTSMCQMMAVHIFMMCTMGYYFIYLASNPKRRLPDAGLTKCYYSRASLFFVVGGISQIIPYLYAPGFSPRDAKT